MNSLGADNDSEKQKPEETPYYKEWLEETKKPTRELPIERAVVQKLSEMVIEDDSAKWDEITEVAKGFNELGGELEKLSENFFFQTDIEDLSRKKAKENILRYLKTFREPVEKANTMLNEKAPILGDLIIALLRQPLEMLEERLDKIGEAAEKEDSEKLKKEYKSFENYRNRFLSELVQVLGFVNDPFVKADAGPFEKEMVDNILNALKVPALPEGMLAKYSKQKDDQDLKIEFFDKDYRFFMNVELNLHKGELEEEVREKLKELEYATNSPQLEESLKREYEYWQKMTPEKRYKQLLRLRAFELLKKSAGDKRLTPEFLYRLYSEAKNLPQ